MSKKQDFIVSPKSGKKIRVEGDTYNNLLKDKKYASAVKSAKIERGPARGIQRQKGEIPKLEDIKRNLEKSKPQQLAKTIKNVPKTRKTQILRLKTMIDNEGNPKGKSLRGWGAAAPQRGKERHELMHACGRECFLKPDTEGFPICAALREGNGCKVDCRGIIAAKVRAGEWKYSDVIKATKILEKEYGCK